MRSILSRIIIFFEKEYIVANLKELFPEFYQDSIDEKHLSGRSENIIILDTNYLLEVIKSPTIVSKQYVEAIEKVKNNIYIPYLVALEFNFNKSKRKKIKMQEINNYKSGISDNIEKVKEKIKEINLVNNDNKEKFTKDIIKLTEKYSKDLQSLIDTNIESIVTNEQENLYNRLIKVIENKIGDPYTQEWILDIEKEGQNRFDKSIPPGFDDSNKDDYGETREYGELSYHRKFGDLIIWKDIIHYSNICKKKGKKVIFVTDDGKAKNKKDLLYKVNNLVVGPNIFLMNELQREAKKEFYILNNLRFIQLVNNLSDEQVNELKVTLNSRSGYNNKYKYINSDIYRDLKSMILDSNIPEDLRDEILYKLKGKLTMQELDELYQIIIHKIALRKEESDVEKENSFYQFNERNTDGDNIDMMDIEDQEERNEYSNRRDRDEYLERSDRARYLERQRIERAEYLKKRKRADYFKTRNREDYSNISDIHNDSNDFN